MKKSDDLIKELIQNRISRIELETLLEGLEDADALNSYKQYLEYHYKHLLNEYFNHINEKNKMD